MKWIRDLSDFLKDPIGTGFIVGFGVWILLLRLFGPTTCRDGWGSSSIGIQGACSHHGGVDNSPVVFATFGAVIVGAMVGGIRKAQVDKVVFEENKRRIEVIKEKAATDGIACPLCGFPLKRRTASKGPNRGELFMGCSKYPVCRGLRSLNEAELNEWGKRPKG